MRAGRYKQRVTFQKQQKTQSTQTGNMKITWVTATTVNGKPLVGVQAEVLTGPGREQIAAGVKHSEVSARIALPWFAGLAADWRVLCDGAVYDITGVSTDATGRREWRLVCKAGLNNGQ